MTGIIFPMLAASALSAPVLSQDIAEVDVAVVTGPGTAVYEIVIGPDGWVEDCRVLRSDYSPARNARVCNELLTLKARKPARGADGKPIHALATVVRDRGGEAAPLPADVVVEVARLPDAVNGRRMLALDVLVDADGRMRECQPATGDASALSRVACEQAAALRLGSRQDHRGQEVPYLARVTVEFVQDGTSS